jgi:hypothetical protein
VKAKDSTPAYTASIDWGDGTTTPGTVSPDTWGLLASGYNVGGTHTYASAGQYTVTVTITAPDGSSTTVTDTATVAAEPTQPGPWPIGLGPF